MCGASIGLILPRSLSIKCTYFLGLYLPDSALFLALAVLENRCISNVCADCFQRTPLQHFLPYLYRLRYEYTSSAAPAVCIRLILFSLRFWALLWCLASRRSSDVILNARPAYRQYCDTIADINKQH